jgi:hypothetical protein
MSEHDASGNVETQASLCKNLCSYALLLAQESEQEML